MGGAGRRRSRGGVGESIASGVSVDLRKQGLPAMILVAYVKSSPSFMQTLLT